MNDRRAETISLDGLDNQRGACMSTLKDLMFAKADHLETFPEREAFYLGVMFAVQYVRAAKMMIPGIQIDETLASLWSTTEGSRACTQRAKG